jgi:hypothetical protein
MNAFRMLKLPVMLLGFAAALLFYPACKAQEVSPDHFTDTGVQNVYEPAPAKAPAPKVKPKPATVKARSQQTNAQATVQLAANRTPVSPVQPAAEAVAEKRKIVPATPNKQ